MLPSGLFEIVHRICERFGPGLSGISKKENGQKLLKRAEIAFG